MVGLFWQCRFEIISRTLCFTDIFYAFAEILLPLPLLLLFYYTDIKIGIRVQVNVLPQLLTTSKICIEIIKHAYAKVETKMNRCFQA